MSVLAFSQAEKGTFCVEAHHDNYIGQLMNGKADKVHPIPSDDQAFVESRIGGPRNSKQTWIKTAGHQMSAALYTCSSTTHVADEHDLLGNVSDILSTPSQPLDSDPTMIIFYSISSFGRGAGRDLINDVYEQFVDKGLWLSTLSPLRGLTQWVGSKGLNVDEIRGKDHTTKRLSLEYLLANENGVQNFHMKNGAYIGDINLNANIEGSDDYRDGMNVMVNYVYPDRVQREINKQSYAAGNIMFAPHLCEEVSQMSGLKLDRIVRGLPKVPSALRLAIFK